MSVRDWSLAALTVLLGLTLAFTPSPAQDKKAKARKVVLIAGPLDASHPRGTHEYEKSVRLLKRCLETSSNLKGVRVEAHFGGWPRDEAVLDGADTIVLLSSGSDRREADHPLLVGDRLQVLGKHMKRGCGLVTIHWTTFFPNEKAADTVLEWVGGHFDYQSGPGPRKWASDIKHVTSNVKPATPDHPICRGLSPFKLRDEFYFKMRFREKDDRLKPILLAPIDGVKDDQVVAWAVERKDGGRGFGFTGGHYFDNWWVPEFRKMVLNAIVWTAGAAVPEGGVESTPPPATAFDHEREGEGTVVLTDGKFGKALDARKSPVVIDGRADYRRPPLTVECWAKLNSRGEFNALVASDTKTAPTHWELYTQQKSGFFAAYIPGRAPTDTVSETDVCDGKWHYLAMTYDGERVELFVDGRRSKTQAVAPVKTPPKGKEGALTVGLAQGEDHKVHCDGIIDEVRISRVVRAIDRVPDAEFPLDPQTVGLWHFNEVDAVRADPAWTPRPATGNAAAWEKESDADWVDTRLGRMDTGPFFDATFDYPSWKGKTRAYKGTAIRLGDKGEAAVLFDRCQLRLCAGWTGDYLAHSSRRFGLLNTPTPAGRVQFATDPGPGWADPKESWESKHPATAPLPREWVQYRGLYLHGPRTILSYTVGGVRVLDAPWVETKDGMTVFARTLEVGPSKAALHLLACDLPAGGTAEGVLEGVPYAAAQKDKTWTAVALVAADKVATVRLVDRTRAVVTLPPSDKTRRLKVLTWHGPDADLATFHQRCKASAAPEALAELTRGGPLRWTKPITTTGEVGSDVGPFAIDTLTIPYDNPHNALMFLSGVDFLPNGEVAVCTAHGDVWLVKASGPKLEKLTWKRFATGLYQPLGLRVVDGKVVVLERGQLTRLHDLNDDGEADFHECVSNDWHTGGGEHSFDSCLETDPQGNFYFFKTGDPDTPTGGCLLKVSKNGSKTDIFCTGFRHPIGLGMSPTGIVTGADQEGNWMPMTRIDQYKQGGFYGDMRTHHRKDAPKTYDEPICWVPKEIDNSAGGQVWVPKDAWGPLGGQPLHLSYGRCKAYLLMRQEVGDVVQGGVSDLGLFFLSGVCRGRFNPKDGHLYLAGLRGWQTAARRDGCLQRVRYTGKPLTIPVALATHEDGVRLTFACKLDRKAAEDLGRWRVEQWNYLWSGEYGSKRWSVTDSKKEGQDVVPVKSATLSEDGKTVFLRIDGVRPVMQMQIAYQLTTDDGKPLASSVFHTIHKPAPR